MKNEIKRNGVLLKSVDKVGRNSFYKMEDGSKLTSTEFRDFDKLEIRCNGNGKWFERKSFQSSWVYGKIYYSSEFLSTGENNPFFGKHHTEETKIKQIQAKKGLYEGENNPFFGKHHTEETKERIRENISDMSGENNPFFGKHHTEETKEYLSKIWKEKSKEDRWKQHYKRNGLISVSRRPKKTKIEKAVENFLLDKKIKHKYNKIMFGFQYDFLLDNNVLIEVQGDFWHANPKIYGEGLKPLCDRQKFKIERDAEKKRIAEENGFSVIYIWEDEINRNDFSSLTGVLGEFE